MKEFIESTWFKALARLSMLAACGLSGWIGWLVNDSNARIAMLEAQTMHIPALVQSISSLQGTVADVSSDLTATKLDVATIKGMLTREKAASADGPAPALPARLVGLTP